MRSRVGIIGAGFSGLMAAKTFLEMGFDVEIFEEHGKVGFPEHCTGLVSGNVIEMIGEEAKESVIRRFGAIRICYREECVKLRTLGGLFKLDRIGLEVRLSRNVEKLGGKLNLRTKIVNVMKYGKVRLSTGIEKSYDLVILSEGFNGFLRRNLNIGLPKAYKPLSGINYETLESCEMSEPMVIFGDKRTKDFFLWKIPLSKSLCLIGGASKEPKNLIEIIGNQATILKSYGGPVIVGPPARNYRLGRIFVVGDAAGLNKPLTGGGLYPNALLFRLVKESFLEKKYGERLDFILDFAIRKVRRILLNSYYIAKHLRERQETVKCIIRTTKGFEHKLPFIEYDDHFKALREILRKRPGISMSIFLKLLEQCPLELFNALLAIIERWKLG